MLTQAFSNLAVDQILLWGQNVANAILLFLALLSILQLFRFAVRRRRYRPIFSFWKYGKKIPVWIVCSEGDDPEARQWPEDREYIYFLKYGDLDALIEIVRMLERAYQDLPIEIMSSGEFESRTGSLDAHIISIGGPDYNKCTRRLLEDGHLKVSYRSPYWGESSESDSSEIVLFDESMPNTEFFSKSRDEDYGYIERIVSPWWANRQITVLGGNHTIGVSGAAKAFSVLETGKISVSNRSRANFRFLKRGVQLGRPFRCIFKVKRVGAGVVQPDLTLDTELIEGVRPFLQLPRRENAVIRKS